MHTTLKIILTAIAFIAIFIIAGTVTTAYLAPTQVAMAPAAPMPIAQLNAIASSLWESTRACFKLDKGDIDACTATAQARMEKIAAEFAPQDIVELTAIIKGKNAHLDAITAKIVSVTNACSRFLNPQAALDCFKRNAALDPEFGAAYREAHRN